MSDERVIDGAYADLKIIKGRKVLQVVVEVPLELADQVTAKLGWPNPHAETRCAVALLNDGVGKGREKGDSVPPAPAAKPNRHIRRFMALANDRGFWNYLRRVKGKVVLDEAQSVATLKALCGIISREELVDDSPASETLAEIAGTFNNWMRQ